MSINHKTKDDKRANVLIEQSDLFDIKIQCPECCSIFVLNQYGEFFCRRCDRIFREAEIRARCGL